MVWPFGKDEEEEAAAPNMAIIRVPQESKIPGISGIREEFIRVRFNEDGTVAAREKVPRDEAYGFIDSGEAFMINEKQLDRIRKGKPVSEVYKETLEADMEEEAEAGPVEEGYIEKKRKESPLGAGARKKRLDKAIEGDNGY